MTHLFIWIFSLLASLPGHMPITPPAVVEAEPAPVSVAVEEEPAPSAPTTTTTIATEGRVCVASYPRPAECDAPPVTIEPWLQAQND